MAIFRPPLNPYTAGSHVFHNRQEAGQQLQALLTNYRSDPNAVVIGLPRGGVVVAYYVARGLHLSLDITCPRKIGAPFNPEVAIGAITETGQGFFNEQLIAQLAIAPSYIHQLVEKEKKVAQARLQLYRKNHKKIPLNGKIAIVIDDGIATGATMKAAIHSIRAEGAAKIVAAVPVASADAIEKLKHDADELVCVATPSFFAAISQFYGSFAQVENEEVVDLLQRANTQPVEEALLEGVWKVSSSLLVCSVGFSLLETIGDRCGNIA